MLGIEKRLAFSTLGCPGWSLEEIVANAETMGFSAIELRGVKDGLDVTQIPGFRDLAREAAFGKPVRYCSVNTSIFLSEPRRRDMNVLEAKRTAGLCLALGIPFMRVFGDTFPDGVPKSATLKAVADGMAEISEMCENKICVLLEVHGDFNKAEILTEIMSQLPNWAHAGLIWDVEHSFRAYGNDIEGFYKEIRPWVKHIHMKDCVIRDGKTEPRLPGEGDLDVLKIVCLLESGGYEGLYSFEWEKRWRPELESPEEAFPAFARFLGHILKSN
jgi:sugar phosphate isomerase/epimerase